MLCGIDEAGRGCIAGPLVVAGVVLTSKIEGLDDSKKLSKNQREELFEIIIKNSFYRIVFTDNKTIDKMGLSFALRNSIQKIKNRINDCDSLIDGNSNYSVEGVRWMIKADAKISEVSAASILAKVSRDRYMLKIDKKYPLYGFKEHKGYGTKKHIQMIKEFGLSKIHRKSFKIKELREPTLFD